MAADLANAVSTYRAGLEAELMLLQTLQGLAARLKTASGTAETDELVRTSEERERIMASLLALEDKLKPIRRALSEHRAEAAATAGFGEVLALHRAAGALVAGILSSDQETVVALREAEVARRLAAQAIETGETTLSAYRKVIAPPLANAALVDRRG